MIDKLQQQLTKTAALRQNRGRWLAILAVMAALVAAATAYALVRPAITLESATYCGREEHAHTAACYTGIATGETAATPETATCGKEEHTHTLACYADPSADVEDAALWAQSVAQAELTGDWPHDAAAVAQTQLGYAASEKNYTVDVDGETKHPYTRYGAWGGDAYADWNLPFVNFCLQYAGVPMEDFPQADTLTALLQWLADDPARYAVAGGYTPQPGDVALLAENGTDVSAVGIVAELCPATDDEAAKVAVIEADASGTVRRVEYAQDDAQLAGYAILPQNPDYTPATEETAEPEATATPEPEFDVQEAENDEPATIADDAAEEKTITSITAKAKSNEPIPAGKKLTPDMFTLTVHYSDGTSVVLPDPVTVTSPNWPNNYPNNMKEEDNSWTTTFPGVKALDVTFDATSNTESNWDKIYLYDKSGTLKETLSGTAMAGNTYIIPGDTVKITMSSDGSVTYKGFSAAVTAGIQLNPKRVPNESGNFTVSLALRDESGNPTEISTTVELTAAAYPDKNICGNNAQWTYDDSDGTLTITGTGATYDYAATDDPAPWSKLDVQKLVIQDGITSVGTNSFVSCSNLQSVTIPASLQVDASAFTGCTAITELNVTGKGNGAMTTCPYVIVKDCTGDLHVTLADGIYPASDAFKDCTKLKSVKLEGNFSVLYSSAFENCTSMVSVELPDSITRIYSEAFRNCDSLKSISIPPKVSAIGRYAFGECDNLKTVVLPEGLETIGDNAFYSCRSLESIQIPDSVKTIGYDAFEFCTALREVSFGAQSNLETLGYNIFYECKNLAEIDLPESIKSIGSGAFLYTAITTLTIPQNVETVGSSPLLNASNQPIQLNWNARKGIWNEYDGEYKGRLLTITVGKSVEELPAKTMQSFATCGAEGVRFEGDNWLNITSAAQPDKMLPLGTLPTGAYYADENGALYRLEDDHAVLAYLPAGLTEYTVPETVPASETEGTRLPVTAVDSFALGCASDLERLTFQKAEQVTEISDYAFANAGNLSAINDATTASTVMGKFSATCKKGLLPFMGTKIGDDEPPEIVDTLHLTGMLDREGKPTLEVTVQTYKSTKYPTPVAEDRTKVYYTGEAAATSINISNPVSAPIEEDDGAVVRLYMDFGDAAGKPQIAVGSYTIEVKRGSEATVYNYNVTKVPGVNRYCFEIQRPRNGDTISLNLTSGYASPKTGGGTNRIYGAILSETEKEALKNDALPPITQYQNLRWETKADDFPVTKKRVAQSVNLAGDGEGHGYVTGVAYNIAVARSGNTLEGVGKDLMASMEYTDVLTLPREITISDKVRREIEANSYRWDTASYYRCAYTSDGEKILELRWEKPDRASLADSKLAINEEGKLVVYWTVKNDSIKGSDPTEMPNASIKLSFGDKTLYVAQPEADKDYEIRNDVSVTEHFSYSADKIVKNGCSFTFKAGAGKLAIYKSRYSGYENNMGDKRKFKIEAVNTAALPYKGLAFLTDELPYAMYLSADDIAELFQNNRADKNVALTIENATICAVPKSDEVHGMDGTSVGTISVGNTNDVVSDNKYNGMNKDKDPSVQTSTAKITVKWSEDEGLPNQVCFTLSDKDGIVEKTQSCAIDGKAIQSLLDSWGYLVTEPARYTVLWDLRNMLRNEDGDLILLGGQRISYDLSVTNKDTFMMLGTDQKYQYPANYVQADNYAYGYNESWHQLDYSRTYNTDTHPEFSLVKGGTINGQDITENSDLLASGAIIDYSLTANHTGSAHYDILPLTDHISGAQVLLAEVEKNRDAAWAQGLQTVTDADGTQYYKLETAGTYEGVWLGDNYADSVKVADSSTGRDTIIKWYFTNYEGARSDTIHYKALLQLTGQASGLYYLHNETWLGDHETHRLYNEVGWTRLDYTFDKKIVEGDADLGDGKDYCPINQGQTITYRLKLQTIQQGTYTLNGASLYDALPKSLGKQGGFRWTKGNEQEPQEPGTVNIVKYECEGSSNVVNPESWSITTDEYDDSRQYIKWGEDFSVTISEKPVYIYVQLTFPKDAGWQEYAKQYGAQTLENTFYVEGVPDTVTHDLVLPAQAYLQKGVWKTSSTVGTAETQSFLDSTNSMARWYYSNDDMLTRFICYYVVIRNDGQTRLYLNDMQDTLPQGFTLETLVYRNQSRYYPKSPSMQIITYAGETTTYFVPAVKADGTEVSYRTATVRASVDENDATKLTFHFDKAPSNLASYYENSLVSYDEQRGKCYLDPGEAVQFGYYCRTNDSADTLNTALNTVTMPYYDYTGGGVELGDGNLTALEGDRYTPNDGVCVIWDNSTAAEKGFTPSDSDLVEGGKSTTQWLESDVTVTRGDIAPGITKKLAAKISQNNIVTNEPLSAHPTDTLRWNVIAQNNGTLPIIDYVLSDTLPSPFEFSSWINLRIDPPNVTDNTRVQSNLLRISKTDKEDVLKVEYYVGRGGTDAYSRTTELKVNGDPVEINVYLTGYIDYNFADYGYNVPAEVAVTRDEETQATTLWIHFSDARLSLPEGATATLTYDTKIPSNTPWRNTVYTNSCNITPMVQPWDTNAVNQGNATTQTPPFGDEQERSSVRNSAPVTVAFGYTTSSLKTVEQVDDTSNKATSDDAKNYIMLPDAGTAFRYKLEVNNADPSNASQQTSMNELILIDSLPQPGDHTVFQPDDPRYSAFKVSLAKEYDPVVTITDKDRRVRTLTDSEYTLEFSDKTTFTGDDWDGTSTWSTNPTGARALRLKLKDPGNPDSPLMPSGCTIALSFTCVVDDPTAAAGQVAWNSFGYHYTMHGSETTPQEAAPLKVGVMLPTRPTLQKKLQLNGAPYAAEQDETFTFYCYTGQPLTSLPDNWTADDLKAALTADKRTYQEINLTVPEGATQSDVLTLTPTAEWQWQEGETYTLVEAPADRYTLAELGGMRQSAFTFTYDPAKAVAITAVNDRVTWNFTIEKVDADAQDTRLADAWFALYSPDKNDAMTDDDYNALTYKPDRTVKDGDQKWYLTQVDATKAENGFLTFSGLLREAYRYKEFRAPNGYTLDDTLYTITRTADGNQIRTVTNKSGYVLPKTGGCGTMPFTAAGLLLTAAAACLLYRQYKRRRGKTTRAE